ncbi:MAG: mitochondrial peripheral inner membrane protein [Chrysothrix sp. TS-e1954]|nr:MAG: mitochondrial peripheral inner membrane protein [Chrysothrix sp. TS-e1954]
MHRLRLFRHLRAPPRPSQVLIRHLYSTQPSLTVSNNARVTKSATASSDPETSIRPHPVGIPFPSFRALTWAIPVVIGSMIFYVYYFEPYKYKKAPGISLNQWRFAPCTLLNKDNISETSSIFSLRHGKIRGVGLEELWQSGTHSIEVKQPQLQISRLYTPLPPVDAGARITYDSEEFSRMRLLVRRERNGEVSNYLHSLPVGSKVEVRGPFQDFKLPTGVEEVVFIAGGTGIAPALQVAYALATRKFISREAQKPRMSILWASRTEDDAFGPSKADETTLDQTPVAQLDKISKRRYNDVGIDLSLKQFVDDRKQFIQKRDLQNAVEPLGQDPSGQASCKKIILVSGPDGFVQAVAGPKLLQNGQHVQGPLKGLLSQIDTTGWEITKL